MTASNYSLNLYGCNVDPSILKVCRANLWTYVPWAILRPEGIEGLDQDANVQQGDSLKMVPTIGQVSTEEQERLLKQGGGSKQLGLFDVEGEES